MFTLIRVLVSWFVYYKCLFFYYLFCMYLTTAVYALLVRYHRRIHLISIHVRLVENNSTKL